MKKVGFDSEKYIEEQSKYILERIHQGEGDRLYLEFGGKLVHDRHAMRVLPGFDQNAKIKLLQKLKDQAEVIICIYAGDIMTSKIRQDFHITYDLETLRRSTCSSTSSSAAASRPTSISSPKAIRPTSTRSSARKDTEPTPISKSPNPWSW